VKTTRNPNAPEAQMERRPARPSGDIDANSRAAILASLSRAEIRSAQRTTAGRRFLARLKGDLEHRTAPGKTKAKKPSTPLTLAQARLRALKLRNDAGRQR
jgi:hypothetical protein